MSRHLGLIIGVNQYQDSTFRPLQCAENDARALAQWLVNTRGGKWSPPDVQLVQGQHATKELVESLISQLCLTKAEPGDVILIYFAGHAFIDERTGEGYIALTNAHYQDTNTCLSLPSLTQHVMARSPAAHILCIIDCFQTGQIWNMRRTSTYDARPLLGPTVLNMLQAQPNRLLLTSCRGNDYAPEVGESGLGLFMHSMIIGLSGPAINDANGQITLQSIQHHLTNTLGEQQQPQLFGQQLAPLVLVGELPTAATTKSFADLQPVGGPIVPPTPILPGSMGGPQPTGSLLRQTAPFNNTNTTGTLTPPHGTDNQTPQDNEQLQQRLLQQAQQDYQAQNYGNSYDLVEQVLHIAPQNKEALILKGQLQGTAGRYPEARRTIEQLLQIDQGNAIGWSMLAVVLSNQGNYKPALDAIERSLELDPQNPESYAIKNNITGSIALATSQAEGNVASGTFAQPEEKKKSGWKVFGIGLGLHILGFVLGIAGFGLLTVSSVPAPAGLLIASLGLGLLITNTTIGAFRHGLPFPIIACLAAIVILAGLFVTYRQIDQLFTQISVHPSLLKPATFFVCWLIAAAALPFVGALGGWIGHAFRRGRKK